MKVEIITIGDEILIGQIVDTNSAWMAEQLNRIGAEVVQITSVSDNEHAIHEALDLAAKRAQIVLVSGGLGPTRDDITRGAIASYFHSTLVLNPGILKHIEALLIPRGVIMNELNKKQAEVPDNCITLHNARGTAPGMWFEKEQVIFVFMPGVPFEMKTMMENEVIPRLKPLQGNEVILHRTIHVQGMPESHLAQLISGWEDQLPPCIRLAYLPTPGVVRLRMTARGTDREYLARSIEEQEALLVPLVQKNLVGFDEENIQVTISKLLIEKGLKLSVAESCTGGRVASLCTSIPGSSAFFTGGVIAYDNSVKTGVLGVQWADIVQHGAVSEEVVEQMATGVIRLTGTDIGVATSGIAGPGGAVPGKPVGTVCIAVAWGNRVISRRYQFGDNRERNIERASITALAMVRHLVLGISGI